MGGGRTSAFEAEFFPRSHGNGGGIFQPAVRIVVGGCELGGAGRGVADVHWERIRGKNLSSRESRPASLDRGATSGRGCGSSCRLSINYFRFSEGSACARRRAMRSRTRPEPQATKSSCWRLIAAARSSSHGYAALPRFISTQKREHFAGALNHLLLQRRGIEKFKAGVTLTGVTTAWRSPRRSFFCGFISGSGGSVCMLGFDVSHPVRAHNRTTVTKP